MQFVNRTAFVVS